MTSREARRIRQQAEAERVAARMRGLETDVLVMGADLRDARAEVERLRAVINMAHDALTASQWSDSKNYGCTACCPDCRETDEHSSSCDHAKAIEACRSALEVDEALRRAGGAP